MRSPVGGGERSRGRVGTGHGCQTEVDAREAAEDAAGRVGDVLRLEPRRRDLVEEREKAVVVARVDPQGGNVRAAETAHGAEARESRPQNDYRRGHRASRLARNARQGAPTLTGPGTRY